MFRDRGQQVAQLGPVNHAFMRIASRLHLFYTSPEKGHVINVFGDLDLLHRLKAAIVLHDLRNSTPHLHRQICQRDLFNVTPQAAHSAGIHPRCVTANPVLFQQRDAQAALGGEHRGGAAVQASTYHQ